MNKNPLELVDKYGQDPQEGNMATEAWQYGIQWDGFLQAGRVSGRESYLDRIRDEATILFSREEEGDVNKKRLRRFGVIKRLREIYSKIDCIN